jgi:transposase
LQRRIFDQVKKVYKLSDRGLVYDVTNTYFYGKKCPLAKLGKDKEGVKGRPLIQIGLGVTKQKGVPVVHKVYAGNIHDSRTLRDMLTCLREFNFKQGYIVFDRGISSKKNQQEITSLEWEVICGLPLNPALKRFLAPFMANNEFLQYKNRVRLKRTVFYAIVRPYSIADVSGKLVMCLNEQQRKDLRESRYDEIHNAQKLLQQGKRIKEGLDRYFDSEGNVILKEVRKAEEFDGYSVIFTTATLAKEQIVGMYFDKDLVEKAFQSLKGVTKLRPIRHWLYNRVIAHVFICYLSYLLLTLMRIKLGGMNITAPQALKELGTMYRVHMRDTRKDFKITKVVTLTKKQENILKAIDRKLLMEVEDSVPQK